MNREIVFIIFTTICMCGKIITLPNNETTIAAPQDPKDLCQQSCSKPNWEFRITGMTCICWVDDRIDDLDAEAMRSTASKKGLKLLVIPKTNRDKRDTVSTTEETTETIVELTLTPQSDQIQETKPRMSDVDNPKESKRTHDSILGDSFHKSLKSKLTPNRRQIRGCSGDSVKFSLQGLKQHAERLLGRADQGSFTCALLIPELEAMKLQIQQLISRAGEKKDSNIFEQIKMREKERQARIQSRLGHFELPKRPNKLNLVGGIHKKDKVNDNKENKNKKLIIVQPPELIDDAE